MWQLRLYVSTSSVRAERSAGGIGRGEIGAYMGQAGSGKSLLLVKAAVRNLLRAKKVLFISLEMDQDKIARRFDAQLAVADIKTLIDNRAYVIEALKDRVKDMDKQQLVIKQFPAGVADMHTIRAYCAQLNLHGFKPDLLCVDYVGEFKDDVNVKTYESRQRIVRDLRGFGVAENHGTFTALQSNRMGRDAQKDGGFIDDENVGDSYGQLRPLDACWSLNQQIEEKSQNVGRMFVVKHRDGRSRYSFPFKQDMKTLDICEISYESYNNIRSQFVKKKGEDTEGEIQKVVGKKFKQNGSNE